MSAKTNRTAIRVPRFATTFFAASFCGLLAPPPAAAQADNAILAARDGFGERVGVETAGIYTETQVRGFSLTNTGAHRIDGAYYVRDYALPDAVLSGVSVISGVAGARLAYPSPSGVVNYRLKSVDPGARQLSVTAGVRDYGQTVVEAAFAFADREGRLGLAGGALWTTPVEFPNEVDYRVYNVGLVPQWKPNDRVRVRGMFAAEYSDYRGEIGFLSAVAALPPKIDYHNYGPPYAELARTTLNGGVLVDATIGDHISLSATTFYADHRRGPADFSLWTLRPDLSADLAFNRTVEQHSRSLASEAVAAYAWRTGRLSHTVSAAVRNRRSRSDVEAFAPVRLGTFDLRTHEFPYPPEPAFAAPAPQTASAVDQLTGSLGYTLGIGDAVELRGAVHRSRYDKRVDSAVRGLSERLETRWLYNAAIVATLSDRLTVFADTVKGIEETGIAPQNAVNREEVLPPVVAETIEGGVRYALTPGLSLTATVFEVKKPTTGLRPDGVFAVVGTVRHRGAELSVSGQIAKGTAVVVGALAMKPRLTRPGQPTIAPVGVSPEVLVVSVNHELAPAWFGPGWSIDARFSYQSARDATQTASYTGEAIPLLTLGARYNFSIAGAPAQLRVSAVNVGNFRPWNIATSGILMQTEAFRIRASLRVDLL